MVDFPSLALGCGAHSRSQSYGERALRALKGERALKGDSAYEDAGEAGMRRRPRIADDGADVG
ncbi:hypothetical protein BTUL_0363g00040 [Botrytis tulipae]|uniref:Uncharacterized protein n=1 Tax=Botrytis tulipae TaxID=87230 RepID=A0A4Z1E4F3_9HELO|nr:hypothetical protein BTUL_0363g00040 [Botrytis tulipae]